jgi:hypothetical protein
MKKSSLLNRQSGPRKFHFITSKRLIFFYFCETTVKAQTALRTFACRTEVPGLNGWEVAQRRFVLAFPLRVFV